MLLSGSDAYIELNGSYFVIVADPIWREKSWNTAVKSDHHNTVQAHQAWVSPFLDENRTNTHQFRLHPSWVFFLGFMFMFSQSEKESFGLWNVKSLVTWSVVMWKKDEWSFLNAGDGSSGLRTGLEITLCAFAYSMLARFRLAEKPRALIFFKNLNCIELWYLCAAITTAQMAFPKFTSHWWLFMIRERH